jgi:hypothetical protein
VDNNNSLKKYLRASIICLLSLLLAGILFDREYFLFVLPLQKQKRVEAEGIKEAVLTFNSLFMDVYASEGSPEMIDMIPATTEMRHRMFKDAGYLRFTDRVLVYDMASIEVERVTQSGPFDAEAVTYEEWNYVYQDGKTRKPVTPIKGMDSRFRYRLIKKDGKWLVKSYVPLREEEGDDESS